jgi:AcrR family transcriptional regulator
MATVAVRNRVRPERDVRREQILDAAIRIIGQRGYNGFGIQELAQRCDLTNAGLLYHFGSKDRLLIALLEDRDRRDAEAVTSVLGLAGLRAGTKLTLDTVFKLLRAIVARNAAQPELVRLYTVLSAEAMNHAHPAREYFLAREAATLDVFASMIAPHVPQPRSTARQLLAFMSGLEQQWLRTNQGFDLIEEWDRGIVSLLPSRKRGRSKQMSLIANKSR